MRFMVFGAGGWLGGRFVQFLRCGGHEVETVGRALDISNMRGMRMCVRAYGPHVVINAAGKTHSRTVPNIDGCVEDAEARIATLNANAVGAGVLAEACRRRGVMFVHIGSGCIWNAGPDRRFSEADAPAPVSWYGKTKALGDELVMAANPDALVLRIRMPISAEPHPRNLVAKLAGTRHVIRATNSVTVVEPFLRYSLRMIEDAACGVFHAVHREPLDFRDLMQWYKDIVEPSYWCEFIDPADYVSRDGRSNCVLASEAYIPEHTEQACREALHAYKSALAAHGSAV